MPLGGLLPYGDEQAEGPNRVQQILELLGRMAGVQYPDASRPITEPVTRQFQSALTGLLDVIRRQPAGPEPSLNDLVAQSQGQPRMLGGAGARIGAAPALFGSTPQADINLPVERALARLGGGGGGGLLPSAPEAPQAPPADRLTFGSEPLDMAPMPGPREDLIPGLGPPMRGMHPDLEAEPLGLTPPAPPTPSLGETILDAMVQNITPALVAWAAERFDNPEISQAYARQEAKKIEEAKLAMEEEVNALRAAQDQRSAEIQLANLQLSMANGRRSILDQARQLQAQMAEGNLADTRAFTNAMQAMAVEMAALDGDPEAFLAQHQIPHWDLLKQMREEAIEAFQRSGGDLNVLLNTAPIRHPITGKMISPADAMMELGMVDAEGTIAVPWAALGDIGLRTVTTRDAGGRELSTTLPLANVIGETFTKERQPVDPDIDTIKVEDPTSGVTKLFRFDRRSGRPVGDGPIAVQGTPSGLASTIFNIQRDLSPEAMQRWTIAYTALNDALGFPPTLQEIETALNNPDDPDILEKIKRNRRATGGR